MTITRNDDREEIRDDNKLIGYIEDGRLFAIDPDGYASDLGPIEHANEARDRLVTRRLAVISGEVR